ncbi:MAG: YeeE/YedE family protein [Roseobacter sp.]|jgi:uncharacterized membrane protein YedE/YeeE|nr:YeeE/YedE family protein [Roseobacter sp.]
MFDSISDAALLALVGFLGGGVLGLAARMGRFCTLGAIEDVLYQGSDQRLRMWLLAISVAALGSFSLIALSAFDPASTVYYQVGFSPLASIFGGLLFGYGMSLAGTCGFGALARSGGGDLRAVVIVLVMGVAAYVMLSGPLSHFRVWMMEVTTVNTDLRSFPDAFAQMTGQPAVFIGGAMALVMLMTVLASKEFRSQRQSLFWGTMVGLAVAGSWAGTYWVYVHGFTAETPRSFTFTAPLGETMLFLMTSSGGGLSFGVGSVFGVLTGALAGSLFMGHFRWEACEDPRELRRQCLGAVCMGFGAVLAFGCTIGQGISAFSLFTFSAPLTFCAIMAGAALGLRQLISGFALNT